MTKCKPFFYRWSSAVVEMVTRNSPETIAPWAWLLLLFACLGQPPQLARDHRVMSLIVVAVCLSWTATPTRQRPSRHECDCCCCLLVLDSHPNSPETIAPWVWLLLLFACLGQPPQLDGLWRVGVAAQDKQTATTITLMARQRPSRHECDCCCCLLVLGSHPNSPETIAPWVWLLLLFACLGQPPQLARDHRAMSSIVVAVCLSWTVYNHALLLSCNVNCVLTRYFLSSNCQVFWTAIYCTTTFV